MKYPSRVFHVEHGPAFVASREEFVELEIRTGKGWNPDPVAAARGESVSPETNEQEAEQLALTERLRADEAARVKAEADLAEARDAETRAAIEVQIAEAQLVRDREEAAENERKAAQESTLKAEADLAEAVDIDKQFGIDLHPPILAPVDTIDA